MSAVTRYLVLKGYSGLGNRLSALLQAIVYAKLTERELIIDWNDFRYSSDETDVFHRLFSSPRTGSQDAIPRDASVAPSIWQGSLHQPMEKMLKIHNVASGSGMPAVMSVDSGQLNYAEPVAVFFDYAFRYSKLIAHKSFFPEEWKEFGENDLMRKLLKDYVVLDQDIAKKVGDFKERHFGNVTIGIHIRQTDNMRTPLVKMKGVSVTTLESVLVACLQENPNASIFVATDNKKFLKDFQEKYSRVISWEKWFPEKPGEPLHGHRECPDKLKMAEDALIDLYLLAECHCLIYSSYTSFSRIAHLLPQASQQLAIDIEEQ